MILSVFGVFECCGGVFGCLQCFLLLYFWVFFGDFECFWVVWDVLGVFWGAFGCLWLWKLKWCFKEVSRTFQESLRVFQESFKDVSRKFQG